MPEIPSGGESKKPSKNLGANSEVFETLNHNPIFDSIVFHEETDIFKRYLYNKEIDPKYQGVHLIICEYMNDGGNRLDLAGLDSALQILAKNKDEKVLLMGFLNPEDIKNGIPEKSNQIDLFLSYPNTEFKQLPFHPQELLSDNLENETISNQAIIDSLTFIGFKIFAEKTNNRLIDSLQKIEQKFDEKYLNATIILSEHKDNGGKYQDFKGISQAIELLAKNPSKKIILYSIYTKDQLEKEAEKFNLFMSYKNTEYHSVHEIWNLGDFLVKRSSDDQGTEKKEIDTNITVSLIGEEASQRIRGFRHTLKYMEDPYDMSENEKGKRLLEVQKFFPGLDTFDKAMDYVLHVDLNLPEPMKGKRIEGVYVDVDGTLIDYVGIHSGKEGTQNLRVKVVELLKKYEAEGKEIIVRTGGDVELKTNYLRSLGIMRPVVSKYDYAGAIAQIVIDDTDQNSFIAQSKIYPEVYIDTTNF